MLKPEGARLFGDYTANHIGSYFAITLDGMVLSAPVIQNAIPNGNVEIPGPAPGWRLLVNRDAGDRLLVATNGRVGLKGNAHSTLGRLSGVGPKNQF